MVVVDLFIFILLLLFFYCFNYCCRPGTPRDRERRETRTGNAASPPAEKALDKTTMIIKLVATTKTARATNVAQMNECQVSIS